MKNHVMFYDIWEQANRAAYSPPLQVILKFDKEQDPNDVKHRLEKAIPDFSVNKIENEGNKQFAFLAVIGTNDEELRAAFPDATVEITKLPNQEGGPKMLGV